MQKGGRKYKGKKSIKKKGALTKPQKKEVKKLIHSQIENKRFDVEYAYTNQSYNTGLFVPQLLTNIPQGITVTTRVGDKVILRSLNVRMSVYHNSLAAQDPQNNYRIIVFKWKLNNSIVPLASYILQYVSGALTLNYSVDSPYNFTQQQQDAFAILYDKSFSLSPSSPTVSHNIRLTKYLGNISFENAILTGTGHIYYMVVCDDGLPVGPCPTMGFISRVVFEDA